MSEENVEIVGRIWGSFGDEGHSWIDLFDERCEIRNPPEFPATGPFVGHAGARTWRAEIWEVFSEIRHEVLDVTEIGEGDTVVTIQRTTGRMRHTELPVDIEWGAVWTLRGGKVVHVEGHGTKSATLEAAGLSE